MVLETPNEFLGRERHRCFLAAIFVLFQTERYRSFFVIDVEDTVVADRYFMGISSQVFDHMFRPPERWLGIITYA